jgi:hypothetical protein
MNPEQTGSNYIPSDAIAPIGEEIKALRALAQKNDFDLPYAAPSRTGVLLPAIAKEWTGMQHQLQDFGVEKSRFDFMTKRLSDASFDVCQQGPEDATGLAGDATLRSPPVARDEKGVKCSAPRKASSFESRVLNALAKSKIALRVPAPDGAMCKIDAPSLLTLTQPLATPKLTKIITVSGMVTGLTPLFGTAIVADKFFVRGMNAPGLEIGHLVNLRVRTTFDSLKLDIVDWQPPEGSDDHQ